MTEYSRSSAEFIIGAILERQGCTCTRQKQIGNGIYGRPLRVDFCVEGVPDYPDGLIIESAWQDARGSIDEKFPYLVENIRSVYPCPTIIVISGGKQRSGAVTWLRSQVDGRHLLAVFSMDEFVSWSNRIVVRPISPEIAEAGGRC